MEISKCEFQIDSDKLYLIDPSPADGTGTRNNICQSATSTCIPACFYFRRDVAVCFVLIGNLTET